MYSARLMRASVRVCRPGRRRAHAVYRVLLFYAFSVLTHIVHAYAVDIFFSKFTFVDSLIRRGPRMKRVRNALLG